MSVTPVLVFRAMAHQRDMSRSRELLDETQRELLPMILDGAASRIDWPVHEQFGPVTGREPGPRDSAILSCLEQPLTRSEDRRPFG